MTTTHQTSLARPARQLLGLTSTLLALQVLNLAVFDDLRTDPLAGVVETFTKPQHLSSILCVLLAVVLVATRRSVAAGVAVLVAWIEIVTFTFFHGIPVEIGPSKPYWGDGTGDALQWAGFLSILACSAAIIVVASRRSSSRGEAARRGSEPAMEPPSHSGPNPDDGARLAGVGLTADPTTALIGDVGASTKGAVER